MATTYRSSSTANTGATPASSLTINTPAGAVAGDVLLAAICLDGVVGVTVIPTGWVLSKTEAISSVQSLRIYYKLATGYEAASYTWTFGTTSQAAGLIIDYSGTSGFPSASISVISNTTASTTVTGTSVNNTWTGMSLAFWCTKNTTGVSTITASSGWTSRADTCTTAADFIECEVQEIVRVFPAAGVNTPVSTASQSVTSVCVNLSLDDAHGTTPLTVDEIQNTGFNVSTTSITVPVYTNYPNELLVALVALETGTSTVSSISGAGLTWTQVGNITTQGGDCEVWYAFAPTLLSDVVTTVAFSAAVLTGDYMIFGIANVDLASGNGSSAIGATATANASASSTTSVSLTTTRNNSWVFAVANSSNTSKLTTQGSGQNNMHDHTNTTTSSSIMVMQTSATPVAGTVVTMSASSASVTDWNIYAVEILPSARHDLSSLGVGT